MSLSSIPMSIPYIVMQGGFECSRPLYDLWPNVFNWLICPYGIYGLGLTGVGMFALAGGFIGLYNWSESWEVPVTWLAIVGPAMAAGFLLPGGLQRRIAGVITVGVAMLLVGLYWWWGRS